MGVNFFFICLKKPNVFVENNNINLKGAILAVTSVDLHIPLYLKVIPKKWMVVSYRHLKYLELNLVCLNVVSWLIGKQHDIACAISEMVG